MNAFGWAIFAAATLAIMLITSVVTTIRIHRICRTLMRENEELSKRFDKEYRNKEMLQ